MLPPPTLLSDWHLPSSLWLVLDAAASRPRSMAESARLALEGGVDVVVFRHKTGDFAEVLDQARAVRLLCRTHGARFVLAHALEFAAALEPDAIHVSSSVQQKLEDLRQVAPAIAVWGISTHGLDEARQRLQENYAYCFVGPVFATPSKLPYGEPLGAATLDGAGADVHDRAVWIGGVTVHTAAGLVAQGARHLAVVAAIQSAADPHAAAAALKAALHQPARP